MAVFLGIHGPAEWLLVGASFLLPLAMLFFGSLPQRRRGLKLQAAARQIGLEYDAGDEGLLQGSLASLPICQIGYGRQVANVLWGRAGELDLLLFDLTFTVGTEDNQRRCTQTIVAVRQPGLELPGFLLRPKHLFDTIGEALGDPAIAFPSHPCFAHRYHLEAPDEPAATALFRPTALGFFENVLRPETAAAHQLSPRVARAWCLEGGGEWLLLYRRGRRLRAGDLAAAIDLAIAALAALM